MSLFTFVADKIITYGKTRPLRIIKDRESKLPYMLRNYLMFEDRPWFMPLNVVMHRILMSDPDDFHDHPWLCYGTLILKGGYWEHTPKGKFWRGPGHFRLRTSNDLHRLEVDHEKAGGETVTLFFMGPRNGKGWGFINEYGVIEPWQIYLYKKSGIWHQDAGSIPTPSWIPPEQIK